MTVVESGYRGLKPRRYGTTADVVTRSIVEIGDKPESIAKRLGVSRSTLHGFADPNAKDRVLWSHQVALVRAGARAPVEALCAEAGGHFVPGTAPKEPLPTLTARVAKEHAEWVASVLMQASPEQQLKEADEFIASAVQARAAIVAAAHAAKRASGTV